MTDSKIALVCTVLDEADTILELLASVDAQTRRPDEIVIVDGGSTDGTEPILRAWAAGKDHVKLLCSPGVNIARGRNEAVAAATGEIIAVTDGGCVLDPDWLAHLAAAFDDPDLDVAMGFYEALPASAFERLVACLNLPEAAEIDPERFMPSSRSVAFRRRILEAVGGYPEWLEWGEDMYLNHRMLDAGARRAFVPEAVVSWRLRPDLRGFVRQYYRYAYGDGKAGMYTHRHLVRFGAYAGAALCALGTRRAPWLAALPVAAAAVWLLPAYRRALARAERPTALLTLPALTVVMDAAKMAGYLAGRRRRRR